jgi:hypothetical protein
MLLLIDPFFTIRPSASKYLPLVLFFYAFIDIFYAFLYDKGQFDVLIRIVLFFVHYGKTITLFLFLFGKAAKRAIAFSYIIYAATIAIFSQTILLIFYIQVEYTTASSLGLLNWVESALSLVVLMILLLVRHNIVFINTIHMIFSLSLKVFLLIFFMLTCIIVLENNIFSQFISSDFISNVSRLVSVFLTISLVLFIVYFMIINNTKNLFEERISSISHQMDVQISHYEMLKAHDEDLRRFRHDYHNMILCMKSLLQANDVEQTLRFIDDISDSFELNRSDFDSGNYIVDALLLEKQYKAKKDQITIDFDGLIPTMKLINLDLCIILGNALDNAIEGCSSMAGEKTIHIDSAVKNGFWFLTIENPTVQDVPIRNNTVRTSKKDTHLHGFGLYNIGQVVKKNGGQLKLQSQNKIFTLEIAMKLNPVESV